MKNNKNQESILEKVLTKLNHKVNLYLWERNIKRAATSIAKEDGINKKSIQYHYLLKDLANATNLN